MSSTLRQQQIDELKNYNQNINRQALAKTYSQVALWELERPEITPTSGELSKSIEEQSEKLQELLNEKLITLDRVISSGRGSEKDLKVLKNYSDVVSSFNRLIEPLLKSRFDSRFKQIAKSELVRIKDEVVGLSIGYKKLLKNLGNFGMENIKAYIEAYAVYDFIDYQIDTENYQVLKIDNLKSRIPQLLLKLPEEVQLEYAQFQKRYSDIKKSKKERDLDKTVEETRAEELRAEPEPEELIAGPSEDILIERTLTQLRADLQNLKRRRADARRNQKVKLEGELNKEIARLDNIIRMKQAEKAVAKSPRTPSTLPEAEEEDEEELVFPTTPRTSPRRKVIKQ
jgi:hypothetical protein